MKRLPGPTEGLKGHVHHVPVELALGLVDAGRVDEGHLPLWPRHHPQNPIPGGLRLARDDGELLAGELIEQRALAHVRPANERGEPAAVCLRSHLSF
jgi:hypothetical protein